MTTTNNINSEQKVFVYLRKSTKKAQQEQSIEKQKNAINNLADRLWIDKSKIEYYIDEWYSWFKGIVYKTPRKITRQRKWFVSLLKEIEKQKVPCKILIFEYARLTRNLIDYVEIARLLGINNKQNRKIEWIYFCNDDIWNIRTSQWSMIDKVNDALKYSEKISDNVTSARELKLRDWLFPNDIRLSKWIERWKKYLKLSKDTEFIRKAFEMKAKWNTNKDIVKFLKKNNINISLSHIADRLWKNRLYIWEYTLKSTWEVFKIKFEKNEKPISLKLFNEANNNIWLKKWKYWKK